jgi:PAS domain S-box-containing protein
MVQPCLSGGLWDAGASITVGGYHIANWLIGQVRNEELNEKRMVDYADEIGANRAEFMEALKAVPIMSVEQFNKVSKMLFAFANELSEKAYKNLLLKLEMAEREKAIEKLIDNEEKYRMFIDLAADAFFQGDSIGNFIEVNHSALELTGYSREELLNMNIKELFLAENLSENRLRYDILSKGEKITAEREVIRKDGRKIFVEMNSRKMPNGTYQSFFRDITERKQSQEALRISEEKFRLAFKTSPESININRLSDGMYLDINEGFTAITGYTVDDVIGKTSLEINIWENPQDRAKLVAGLKENGRVDNLEAKFRMKDGTIINGLMSASLINLNNETHIISITKDITERKRAEEALIIAKEKAEESDRLKTAFLANMSHEIRTPMNGILGFANLLKGKNLSYDNRDKYITIIERSGVRMLNIINDIIDISKIEAGQMEVSMSATNINEKIEEIYSSFLPEATENKIGLSFRNTLPQKDALIITDKIKVDAILTNLLKNALKFTSVGEIKFGYNINKGKEQTEIEFYVKDTGTGIPKEQHEVIFERFRQGSESLTRNYEGAGLGLSIAKAYVEILGGKIRVESEPAKGATFYFTIPYITELREKSIENNNVLIRR